MLKTKSSWKELPEWVETHRIERFVKLFFPPNSSVYLFFFIEKWSELPSLQTSSIFYEAFWRCRPSFYNLEIRICSVFCLVQVNRAVDFGVWWKSYWFVKSQSFNNLPLNFTHGTSCLRIQSNEIQCNWIVAN